MSKLNKVTVDTVACPSWWASSNSVKVTTVAGTQYTAATTDTELLPQGVSVDTGQFLLIIPWANIDNVLKVS